MAYFVGDKPLGRVVVVPERDGVPVDFSEFTGASARLGEVVVQAVIEEDGVLVAFPADGLTESGVLTVYVTLTGDGVSETYEGPSLVVEEHTGYHTTETARREWDQAPESDVALYTLLQTAREAIDAYAPALPEGSRVPENRRAAQLLQARETWNAERVSPSGEFGQDSFTATPFPMSWKVQALLRPIRRVPSFG